MLIGRTTWFKKLRNAAIKANNLGIITDISHYHQDHNALCQLIQEQDMLSAKLDLVQERLGLTHGWLESANAPNIIGHLSGKRSGGSSNCFLSPQSKGRDTLPRRGMMSPAPRNGSGTPVGPG